VNPERRLLPVRQMPARGDVSLFALRTKQRCHSHFRMSFGASAPATIILLLLASSAAGSSLEPSGVVVEEIAPNSPAIAAGFRAGDVLFRWEHPRTSTTAPAGGEIASIFDWIRLEIEEAPRGQFHLCGLRDGQPLRLELPAGSNPLAVRPPLPAELLPEYQRGLAVLKSARSEEGAKLLAELARRLTGEGRHELACWLLRRIGVEWTGQRDWGRASAAYKAALPEAESPEARVAVLDPLGEALQELRNFSGASEIFEQALAIRRKDWKEGLSTAKSLSNLGALAWEQRDLGRAEQLLRNAISIQESLAPASQPLANTLSSLGAVVFTRGETAEAKQLWERALPIQERLTPDSRELAKTISRLAVLASDSGDLDTAESLDRRAIDIRKRRDPDGLELAASFSNLGNVLHDRGQLREAEELFRLALTIETKCVPDGIQAAGSMVNLGSVVSDSGDLARAEDFYQQALRIISKTAPQSNEMASVLNNLGDLLSTRGDLDVSEDYFLRALAIWEKLQGKESLPVALALNNLGTLAWERHDLPLAAEYFQRSLEIKQKVTQPDSLTVSYALANLGMVAGERGDLVAAESYFQHSLDIRQRQSPGSLDVADVLHSLATIAWRHGDVDTALSLSRQALEILEKLAPGSRAEAETLQDLGTALRKKGQSAEAELYLCRAIESLENQIGRLGGSHQDEATFRIGHDFYYRELMDLLVESGRPEEAFHVLERYRARAFLQMIAERDLNLSGVPAELENRRRRIDADYDRTQQTIAELDPLKQQAEIDAQLAELRDLRHQHEEVGMAIRQASPRLAHLRYPIPLDLYSTRQALDTGTLLLSYGVGEESTIVFAVSARGPLEVRRLSVSRAELERRIEFFRNLIVIPAAVGQRDNSMDEEVRVGRELFTLLMGPFLTRITKAERLVILPDGPLHGLPWSALVMDRQQRLFRSGRSWQYLIERAPLQVALSATVYAELRQMREHVQPELVLAAFGDPLYLQRPSPAGTDLLSESRLHAAVTQGFRLAPLPGSRAEVTGIAALFPQGVQTYLGPQATEEHAKGLPRRTRYLHFAAHGILNQRFPLDSALALTIPPRFEEGRDNGLLQAWEIFERLRVDADLVVLSACRSGLGGEMGGEGLIGLTRAFQYAGARSVVASLWEVSDPATADLMVRFYRRLRRGRPVDEALRAAQLGLIWSHPSRHGEISGVDPASPFVWAAFQLFGDGK
jgi:CHAT domain-containing protein/Tfp pilus assembly protein PilF